MVGSVRAEGWRMTGSAYNAMDVLGWITIVYKGGGLEEGKARDRELIGGWRIAPQFS